MKGSYLKWRAKKKMKLYTNMYADYVNLFKTATLLKSVDSVSDMIRYRLILGIRDMDTRKELWKDSSTKQLINVKPTK